MKLPPLILFTQQTLPELVEVKARAGVLVHRGLKGTSDSLPVRPNEVFHDQIILLTFATVPLGDPDNFVFRHFIQKRCAQRKQPRENRWSLEQDSVTQVFGVAGGEEFESLRGHFPRGVVPETELGQVDEHNPLLHQPRAGAAMVNFHSFSRSLQLEGEPSDVFFPVFAVLLGIIQHKNRPTPPISNWMTKHFASSTSIWQHASSNVLWSVGGPPLESFLQHRKGLRVVVLASAQKPMDGLVIAKLCGKGIILVNCSFGNFRLETLGFLDVFFGRLWGINVGTPRKHFRFFPNLLRNVHAHFCWTFFF